MRLLLSPTEEPEEDPDEWTDRDSESVADRVSRLATEAMREQSRLVRDSVELGRVAFDRDTDQLSLSRAWMEALTEQSQAYWQAVGSLGLDVAARLIALNSRTAAAVLERLTDATREDDATHRPPRPHSTDEPPAHSGSDGSARRYSLALTGRLGGRAEGTVTVVNRHPRTRRVELSAGLLRDEVTDTDTGARLTVSPDHVTLKPGQEGQVRVGTELTDPALRAGRVYAATVEVSGGDEALIDVVVAVDP